MTNELNCKGLACPMPIIKLNQLVKLLQPGEMIEVMADDPTFESDIKVWCKRMNCELVSITREDHVKVSIRLSSQENPS